MDAEKILVVGLPPFDAGKTTLCKALIYGLREAGIDLVPFKPHSGISYWYQYDVFKDNLSKGSLVCSDIIDLEKAARTQIPLEVLNPVNRLCSPILNLGISEERLAFQEFVAERFTQHDGTTHKDIYLLKWDAKVSKMLDMRSYYLNIKRNAEKIIYIKRFQDLVKAYSDNFDKATSSCYKCIKERHFVIESFNDAACPFSGSEDCEKVLCASSDTILQFDSNKYFSAIESHEGEKSKLQLTVLDIYSPSLITNKFQIQPLNSHERDNPAKLIENYSKIIKQLTKDKVTHQIP
jgi:predicted P-loop ATPase/GTPase